MEPVSGALSNSISFLDSGLTTLGHIAAFLNAVVRGRMDCETVCREALSWAADQSCFLQQDPGVAMINVDSSRYSVLALAGHGQNSRLTIEFLNHCWSVYGTTPALLLCQLYRSALPDKPCSCEEYCCCLLFHNPNPISINLLVSLFPGCVVQPADDLFLLPCATCFEEKTCHVSDWAGLYYHSHGLELGPVADTLPSAMACFSRDEELEFLFDEGQACICMPLNQDNKESDDWTRAIVRMVQTKDDRDRGAGCAITQSLTDYLTGSNFQPVSAKSFGALQSFVPRLVEAVLTVLLSVWFRVDGFSASLISRRAVRDYVTDSMGVAPELGLWVKEIVAWTADSNGSISLAFTFRRGIKIQHTWCGCRVHISAPALCLVMGSMCSVLSTASWCMSATSGKWAGRWSSAYSVPPTPSRAWFCCASIMGCLVLDFVHIDQESVKLTKVLFPIDRNKISEWTKNSSRLIRKEPMLLLVMIAEVVLFVCVSLAILLSNSAHSFHVATLRLLYLSLELLSWAKWTCGSYKLKSVVSVLSSQPHSTGKWVYASAFLSCATMAAVGGKWN